MFFIAHSTIKRIFTIILFLASFQLALPTTGVNIYTIKNGKAWILLSKENGEWTDFTGGKDPAKDKVDTSLPKQAQAEDVWKNVAAREAHEESMGVFCNPTASDPQPENNVQTGKQFFKSRFDKNYYIQVQPNPKNNSRWWHSSWFVKVDYVDGKHFKTVLQNLKNRHAKHDYLEKTKYKWFLMNDLLFKKGAFKISPLREQFKLMIKTSRAQLMLRKIINEAKLKN